MFPRRRKMASKGEESGKIYHSIFAWTDSFALIRWPTINLKLISLFFRNFVSRCLINSWTSFMLDIRLLIVVIKKNFRFIAIHDDTLWTDNGYFEKVFNEEFRYWQWGVLLNFSRVFFDKFFRIHILKMYSLIYLLKRLLENLNNWI